MITNCTAVVLAGGESRRMGSDKAMVCLHGKPMLAHVLEQIEPLFSDTLISVRQLRPDITVAQIIDDSTDRGPMVGIKSALQAVKTDWLFVIACDMPFVSTGLIQQLALQRNGVDAVLTHAGGMPQPLFGFYATRCLPFMQAGIAEGQRSMMRLLEKLNVCMLSEQQVRAIDPRLGSLMSLDSVQDIKNMEQRRDE